MRIGNLYGPDATFLGVPAADPDVPSEWAGSGAAIIGAPFDGGTSHRPGCRFGPQAIRTTDYLPHDGMRPSLALGVDALIDLRVVDLGDVEMPSGDTEKSLRRLEERVTAVAAAGVVPIVLGGDHTIALPDVTGVARHVGWGRVSVIHFDAHADTGDSQMGSLYGHGTPMRRLIESGACRGDRFLQIGLRGYWPEPATLDWMAEQGMRSFEMSEIVSRGLDAVLDEAIDDRDGSTATPSSSRSTSTWSTRVRRRAPAPRNRAGSRVANSSTPCDASPWRRPSAASTSSRSRRPTTTPRSRPTSATGSCSKRWGASPGAARSLRGESVRAPGRSAPGRALVAHRLEDLIDEFVRGVGVQEGEATDGLALPLRRGHEGDLVAQQLVAPARVLLVGPALSSKEHDREADGSHHLQVVEFIDLLRRCGGRGRRRSARRSRRRPCRW